MSLTRALDASIPADAHACVVAFSGGMDSAVLLHAAAASAKIRALGLRAVHIDHGVHADSARWAEHCRAACSALAVPISVIRVEVDRRSGAGLEAALRTARYDAISRELATGDVVLAAHHADDQAETVLQRLVRGSGAAGLSGMRSQRALGVGSLVRPWLTIDRAEIAEYAREHGVSYLSDPSNADLRHDRNFVRANVLPALRERWPRATDAIGISANWLANTQRIVDERVAAELAIAATAERAQLRVEPLLALDDFLLGECIRQWLASLRYPVPPLTLLERLRREMLLPGDEANPLLHWSGHDLRRYRGVLHAMPRCVGVDPEWRSRWDLSSPLALPNGLGELVCDPPSASAASSELVVTFRSGGERFRPRRDGPSKPVKDSLQSLGIPPWERDRIPLLSDDRGVIAVGDLLFADRLDDYLPAGASLRWIITR